MNKLLILFFLIAPVSCFGMDKLTIYRRIAISAEKKDVETDLTFEKALVAIEREFRPGYTKDMTKAFARTYLRMEVLKNYNQVKQELDSYCATANDLSALFIGFKPYLPSLVSVLKRAIDNWDTENPHNIFKYVDGSENILTFITHDHYLGLKDPREKDNGSSH